ncbi:MAG: hypothetical protein H7Y15_09355 [Pseudonocardia sp.]|nr:hypothetical protein [Pseudonocardia sp.]
MLALRVRPDRLLLYGVAACFVMAGPLVALGSTPTLVILLPAMFVAGVAVEQFTVAWDVALQQNVPPDRLARVYSYDALGSFLAIPAGEVAVGPIAELVGIRPTLLGCAAVIVVVTAAALAHPSVRGLRRSGPGGVIVVPGTS